MLASFILDMVAHVPRRPLTGESLIGTDFGMFAGGKGCNQAIAAARSGADVRVIGRLGADTFAPIFQALLAREGIADRWVMLDETEGTGLAFPLIEPDGQNSIVVVPRANLRTTPDDVLAAEEAFAGAAALLVQMEVTLPAIYQAAELAQKHGVRVLFNPAPVPDPTPDFPEAFWRQIDILLPNEREAETLTGIATHDLGGVEQAGQRLIERGCRSVVITLGSRGAYWLPGAGAEGVVLPPFAVQQVDATAAGDAFCGALAAGLAAGLSDQEALRRASAAGALATIKLGAEPSLPTAADIDTLLATA